MCWKDFSVAYFFPNEETGRHGGTSQAAVIMQLILLHCGARVLPSPWAPAACVLVTAFFPFLSLPLPLPHVVCEQVIFFPVLLFPSFSSFRETVACLGLFLNSACCKIHLPLYITWNMKCMVKWIFSWQELIDSLWVYIRKGICSNLSEMLLQMAFVEAKVKSYKFTFSWH